MNNTYCRYAWMMAFVLAGATACKTSRPAGFTPPPAASQAVECWLTDPDSTARLEYQPVIHFSNTASAAPLITLNEQETYQTMDGFGCTLTGGSATLIMQMDAASRQKLLQELFGKGPNRLNMSYLRISIAASDMNASVFSYDDMPTGQTDTTLAHFTLGPDQNDVVPVLQQILKINPMLKILGSPWSAPVWMKDNGDTRGGSLLPRYYGAYARYFVRYIQAMKANGIPINAITVQNEPLHPGNNPSMKMLPEDQAAFVRDALGPAFERAHIKTKIIIYDHNCDRPDYPITVLNDPEANKYIDGSAFHLYGGKIEAMSEVHNAFPNKNIYFTEQWIGAPGHLKKDLDEHIRLLTIGASRNWARTVLEWNLAADPHQNPHTDRGGCNGCLGAITLDASNVVRNPAYYIIGHAAAFVLPGAVRIASNTSEELPNVAFKRPDGKQVLIVLNHSQQAQTFTVVTNKGNFQGSLHAGAVATYLW
ncbi:glucosylceramidase [Chitinophaga costaii]|uniref:Glucosylceramidase n=2 Tax=Chitinophaga costaii TaxID=1335309 RepID=A0A1C4CIR1_9BACT|nr:glucosylceramidase [Chitinophaga costaii]